MPQFTPGRPIVTDDPQVVVEGTLSPGQHRFQLVVVDELGNESDPVTGVVTVRERGSLGVGIVDRITRFFGGGSPPPG
jgi:hypothetical protein